MRRVMVVLAPAVAAVVVALLVTGVVLAVLGVDPFQALAALFSFGDSSQAQMNQVRTMLNTTTALFLAGLAVSIGFRMNLFNIGVEGQYRIATVVAAYVGGALALPAVLHLPIVILAAMAAGAAYAAVPAVLKVTRGVNEVITTIMLNSIAIALAGYLVRGPFRDRNLGDNTDAATRELQPSAQIPGLQEIFRTVGLQPPTREVSGMIVVAIVVGIVMTLVLRRSRFGFELRASGANPSAAVAAGIPAKAMIVRAMLLSGAIAGLVGLPELLSDDLRYGVSFTAGLGFTGIAVALLGRNSPAGIAVAALLFAFLDRAGPSLQGSVPPIPPSAVTIVQGTLVITVVIVNEVARRYLVRAEERRAGKRSDVPATTTQEVAS